jgi:hypothetical protein
LFVKSHALLSSHQLLALQAGPFAPHVHAGVFLFSPLSDPQSAGCSDVSTEHVPLPLALHNKFAAQTVNGPLPVEVVGAQWQATLFVDPAVGVWLMHQPFLLQRASVLSSVVDASHQLLSVQVVPPHTHSLGFFVLPFVDGHVGGSEEPPPPPLLFKLLLTAGTGDGGGACVVHLVPEVSAVLQ